MNIINTLTQLIDKYNILVIVLFGGGIFFTFALKAHNLNFKQIFNALKNSNQKSKDGITGLQSLMIATASRIGNGNIAGVSVAIMVGGPGALFWMWVTALLGMSTAFVEGTLAQLFKHKEGNNYVGGAPFYIQKGLGNKKLASLYAVIAIMTFGGAYMGVQSNTIAANFNVVAGPLLPFMSAFAIKLTIGIIMGGILIAVAIGGVKSIGKFATAVMPVMGSIYLIIALIIIIMNFSKTGQVWKMIFDSAFNAKSAFGGVIGFTMAKAVQAGASRGVFSNEAGIGSATFAAGASNSKHPIQQGLLQSFSTFLDTIIICTASAFIILYAGIWTGHGNSATLIQSSISTQLGGTAAAWLVFIAVFLFGLTTTIGLYYYAETSIRFLTGNKIILGSFQFIIAIYLAISSVSSLDFIWDLATLMTFLLVAINVFAMLPQIKIVQALSKDYKNQLASGKLPVYKNFIDNPEITLWK